MATYTEPSDFRQNVWQLDESEVPNRVLREATAISYERINSILTGVYDVPWSSPYPQTIVKISNLLTKFYVAELHPGYKSADIEKEYKEAMEWLKQIVKGEAEIPGESRLSTKAASFTTDGYEPIFHVDSAYDHEPDDDLLDDIDTDRST